MRRDIGVQKMDLCAELEETQKSNDCTPGLERDRWRHCIHIDSKRFFLGFRLEKSTTFSSDRAISTPAGGRRFIRFFLRFATLASTFQP